jgi:hypothetical protein
MPVIPALRRQKQEDSDFRASFVKPKKKGRKE